MKLFIISISLIYLGICYHLFQEQKKCDEQGGVYTKTGRGYQCLSVKVIK